jgi:hypothetical protein
MKKYLLIMLLIIAGCSSGGEFTNVNYFTGGQGVVTEFAQNTPPRNVYEDTPFLLGANIHNRGATNTNGKIIFEYDSFYFTGSGRVESTFSLVGKQPDYPRGQVDFSSGPELKVRNIEGLRQAAQTRISASVCYPYRTHLTDFFCIDTDVFGTQQNILCRSRASHGYSSQGAPIAITNIVPTVIPRGFVEGNTIVTASSTVDESGILRRLDQNTENTRLLALQPSFEITIKNIGQGMVFQTNSGLDACEASSLRELGRVTVRANLSNNIALNCNPNPVILRDGTATTRCTVPDDDLITTSSSYQEVLSVYLDYYYLDQTSTEVTINRVR